MRIAVSEISCNPNHVVRVSTRKKIKKIYQQVRPSVPHIDETTNKIISWKIKRFPPEQVLDDLIDQTTEIIPFTVLSEQATIVPQEVKRIASKYSSAELKAWVDTLKVRCMGCGETDTMILVFHHKKPEDKLLSVSAMVSSRYAKRQILDEMDKCVILCHNCHMRIHALKRKGIQFLNIKEA